MAQTRVRHVLEPLSADEIAEAVHILRTRQGLPERHRFVQVALHEPSKEQFLSQAEEEIDREAFAILIDRTEGATYEAIVSLTDNSVRSWQHIPDVQPPITLEEFDECERACKADPAFQEALRKRGIVDVDAVMVDPWSAGAYDGYDGRRLSRALSWVRLGPDDNGYAHPIENLVAFVDLNTMEVVRVEDYGIVPIPQAPGNYGTAAGPTRTDLKPLDIHQPEGPSFEIDGHEVQWQRWRFRIGFTPREGLVLHTVTYEDQGRERSILYRASLVEMVVPYGDPNPTHLRKNAFDAGEYNIGALSNSLELGCDCVGEIRYFDAVLANGLGNPYTLRNAVCLHEEDYGVLWKHYNFRTEQTEVRRSRRLVVSFFATVGNYDYGFFWYFYQDGTIQFEGKLTGIVSTGAVALGAKPSHGQLLNPDGLYAPIHLHFFNFRLDFDVDGPQNSVYEVHLEPDPAGAGNPLNAAFAPKATLLRRESEAQQMIDPLRGRSWQVVNPSVTNRLGEPVGYRLVPHSNIAFMAAPEASVTKRATFATKHLWVTPYDAGERHPAGDYPNQHSGGAGLPAWTSADRPIADTDVVLWYTLGCPHMVRAEDWPVMPVEYVGFTLQPAGFFDANPALDVPAPMHAHANGAHHCHSD